MQQDGDSHCQVPSLVQLCQRVVVANVERMSSLGNGLRHELLLPILKHCTPPTLLRFENANPDLAVQTPEIWKSLCFQCYPLAAQQRSINQPPECWREEFFALRDLEAKRLEEIKSRLRNQREEAEQRRKENQIKITDRLPPAKRARGWVPAPPKSLFQKTKSDAAKLQKGIFGARMIPPMPVAKSFRVLSSPSNVKLLPPPPTTSSSVGSRVTVTAVPVRRTGDVPSNSSNPPSAHPVKATSTQGRAQNPVSPSAKPQIASAVTSSPQLPATLSKVNPVKKDPMKALFMPKNRVPPRVSVQVTGIPSRT